MVEKKDAYMHALYGVFQSIQKALYQTVGKSDLAVMRRAGNVGSYVFFPELPTNLSLSEAAKALEKGVVSLEVFGSLKCVSVSQDKIEVEFNDCLISRIMKDAGLECGTQAPCYFGFGLVDETIKRLTGRKATMSFNKHDGDKKICFETIKSE